METGRGPGQYPFSIHPSIFRKRLPAPRRCKPVGNGRDLQRRAEALMPRCGDKCRCDENPAGCMLMNANDRGDQGSRRTQPAPSRRKPRRGLSNVAARRSPAGLGVDPDALWWPLGFSMPPGGGPPWLWLHSRAAGRAMGMRPTQLLAQGNMLALVPNVAHWRQLHPAKSGSGADWESAAAEVMRHCYAAGEIEPPEGIRPRGPGRPKHS